jgi:hypothetical protein
MGLQLLSRWKLKIFPSLQRGVRGNLIGLIQRTCLIYLSLISSPVWSAPQPQNPNASDLDLSPEAIKNSPVLQRWLRQVPHILDDIANDPSFRTRWRLGYSFFRLRMQHPVGISVLRIYLLTQAVLQLVVSIRLLLMVKGKPMV